VVSADQALVDLLTKLKAHDYHFVTVTPATHQRILARPFSSDPSLGDIFGWNRYFEKRQIEPELLELLRRSASVEESAGRLRTLVRVASLGGDLYLHSAFPTTDREAIFFGPDTYRFSRFVRTELPTLPSPSWIVDMGTGSGAGGIASAKLAASPRLTLIDINPAAAHFAAINCSAAGVEADIIVGNHIPEGCDLVIGNPPYLIDQARRLYRNGGGFHGGEVACDWTRRALASLAPGGTLLLYTGAPVIAGRSPLVEKLSAIVEELRAELHLSEIDPDIFGEELDRPDYREAERIAAYGIKVRKLPR
jgi:methylase of polypeptide subunit release factors